MKYFVLIALSRFTKLSHANKEGFDLTTQTGMQEKRIASEYFGTI
jgi:hypothetical protein